VRKPKANACSGEKDDAHGGQLKRRDVQKHWDHYLREFKTLGRQQDLFLA
jgi:hypothetical protein